MARIAGIDIPREKRVEIYKKTTEPLIQYVRDLSLLEYINADRDLKTISSDIKRKMA